MEKHKKHCMDAALGRDYCDLTVENAQLVNMFTGEIYQAAVDIRDGMVVRVRTGSQEALLKAREIYDAQGRYLLPGLIDTHMHVESTIDGSRKSQSCHCTSGYNHDLYGSS